MLRNATKSTTSRGSLPFECVLSSSSPASFSLKSFSTWLESQHSVTQSDHTAPGPSVLPSTRRYASSHRSPYQKAAEEAEFAQLPRFLRRQKLQGKPPAAPQAVDYTRNKNLSITNFTPSRTPAGSKRGQDRETYSASSNIPATFRSRHYDSSNETAKSEIRLLEPHVLSGRLKRLADAGKVDDAVVMLKNAPLDAQNTQVWNTLIWEALKVNRYQLAYQLYIDMKRRGFSPTSRTYQTFFNGLCRIQEWTTYPKQLANARSLYEGFQRHIASVKRSDPKDPDLTPAPLAGYIRLLGSAGRYQEIFDAYYAMDQDGPMAPNRFVWTALFQAIVLAKRDLAEGGPKVAADARLLWTQMIKATKKNPELVPDSHTVSAALMALSDGTKQDMDLAFKIITEYFGLVANGAVSQPGILPLGPESLNTIFQFCNRTKQYEYAMQFLQQVKRRSQEIGGAGILDRQHMEEVLKADLSLNGPGLGYHALDTLEWMLRREITRENGPKIRPSITTYNLVMQACWRSADWPSAVRAFELMTGFHAHDFKDGAVAPAPRIDTRGAGRSLQPNAEVMSSMLRAAFATRNRADMRQALRIVHFIGLDALMRSRSNDTQHETNKTLKHRALFGQKLGSAVLETFDYVMADNGKYAKPDEAAKWRQLAKQAESLTLDDADIEEAPRKERAPWVGDKSKFQHPRRNAASG